MKICPFPLILPPQSTIPTRIKIITITFPSAPLIRAAADEDLIAPVVAAGGATAAVELAPPPPLVAGIGLSVLVVDALGSAPRVLVGVGVYPSSQLTSRGGGGKRNVQEGKGQSIYR